MCAFIIKEGAPKFYSEEFIIRSYHVDINRKLTIQKLCSFFQDIAGNHTVACGVGWEVMHEENVFWVLSRLKIDVGRFPVWEEKITIKTWSNGLDGLLAVRNFQVLNSEGKELIKAVSMWLMVNTETRRLVRPEGYMNEFPLCEDRLFNENPGKIAALNNPLAFDATPVTFTETDMNFHMNNVSYIDRIINSYDFEFLMKHKIEEFEINFLKEAVYGDQLMVLQDKSNEKSYLNSIVKQEDGNETVRTWMKWGIINER